MDALRGFVAGVLGLVAIALWSSPAFAQTESSAVTRFVVPFPVGTGLDSVVRFLAERLKREGESVVVENRVGAGSIIGSEYVYNAPPDGRTLLATTQVLYTNARLYKNLPYDPKGFVPVGRITSAPLVMVAASSAPFGSVQELLALAKAKPQSLSYASLGKGSTAFMSGALFNAMARVELLHVPYKDTSQALTDTMRGEVSINYVTIPTALPQLRAGKIKVLAITGAKRSELLPDVPTIAESGVRGYELVAWHAVFAPPRTPADTVHRISQNLLKVAQDPSFQKLLEQQGLDLASEDSQSFSSKLPAELEHWQRVVDAMGVSPE